MADLSRYFIGERFASFDMYARNSHMMWKNVKWVQDSSKKFSSDAKNSCIMPEAKISCGDPPHISD